MEPTPFFMLNSTAIVSAVQETPDFYYFITGLCAHSSLVGRDLIPVPALTSSVTLSRFLLLSVPPFSRL